MESKPKLNKESEQIEEPKSSMEKLEREVKGTIFEVLYYLLKDDEISFWKLVVMLTLDFLQIINFSFTKSVSTFKLTQ